MSKETKMDSKETKETPKYSKLEDVFEIKDTKQKQTVTDLDSGDDSEIEVIQRKITPKNGVPLEVALKFARSLVQPAEKEIEALLNFAQSEKYRESKETALSKGNYMTSQLRSTLTGMMQNLPAFSECGAKECYNRWLTGYKAGKQSAKVLLERANAALKGSEFSDL